MFFANHIFCCTNVREEGHTRGSCGRKDIEKLRDYMKIRVKQLGIEATRVNNAGCLDRCELGPCIVIYPEGIWYKIETKADVDEIIAEHLQNGRIVTRLKLEDSQK